MLHDPVMDDPWLHHGRAQTKFESKLTMASAYYCFILPTDDIYCNSPLEYKKGTVAEPGQPWLHGMVFFTANVIIAG